MEKPTMPTIASKQASVPQRNGGKTVKASDGLDRHSHPDMRGGSWVKVVEDGTGPEGLAAFSPGRMAKEPVFDLTPNLSQDPPAGPSQVRQATPSELSRAIAALHG